MNNTEVVIICTSLIRSVLRININNQPTYIINSVDALYTFKYCQLPHCEKLGNT